MPIEIPQFNIVIPEYSLLWFIVALLLGIFLNITWILSSKKILKKEEETYVPLLEALAKQKNSVFRLLVEEREIPFFDYVLKPPEKVGFISSLLWRIRGLFFLTLIGMGYWIIVLIMILSKAIPTPKQENLRHGYWYRVYDNAFLLTAYVYHITWLLGVKLLYDANVLSAFGLPSIIIYLLALWGVLFIIADIITVISSYIDFQHWKTFLLEQEPTLSKLMAGKEVIDAIFMAIKKTKGFPTQIHYFIVSFIATIVLILSFII